MEKIEVFEVDIIEEDFKEAELIISADQEACKNYKSGFLDCIGYVRKRMENTPKHYVFDLMREIIESPEQ